MESNLQKSDEAAQFLLSLARNAVEAYVRDRRFIEHTGDLAPDLRRRAGVFVCLKKLGELRGCIGTCEPVHDNIAEEVVHNAISAASRDLRFPPVSPEELSYLTYSIDVLTPYEPVKDIGELDPKRYGVIVQSGGRRGLLLPDLEGVDTAEEQVRIAAAKAGIVPGEKMVLYRFQVVRYGS